MGRGNLFYVAETELQGIFQGDVVVRTAIIRAMDLVREDPRLLNHIFHSLAIDDLTNEVYGEKQIALAREWFMRTEVPVMMNFRVAEEAIPCITISLQESQEADQTHGDIHYVPQETSAGDWPVIVGPFSPVAYSPTSGIMVLPASVMGDSVISAGMRIVTRAGREYPVTQNLGDNEIAVKPMTIDDFTNAVIKGATDRYATKIESVTFRESYQIGIHVMGEPAYLLYLHSILQFMLLKYKQDLLERRNFERTVLSSTDFRRNMEFENEEVFSRYITITGYARHYWPKETVSLIDTMESQLDISELDIGEVGSSSEADPINDQGNPPTADDPWGVIPPE